MKASSFRIMGLLLLLACGLQAAEPIMLHPDNGRYFLWRGKPTILITSGEHYGALLNLDFDYERYFKALQGSGIHQLD